MERGSVRMGTSLETGLSEFACGKLLHVAAAGGAYGDVRHRADRLTLSRRRRPQTVEVCHLALARTACRLPSY
jgi:hypothetical protein